MKEKIFETNWIQSANQLCEIKIFWAEKNGKIGAITATRGLSFKTLDLSREGEVVEFPVNLIANNSESQKKKLLNWLKK